MKITSCTGCITILLLLSTIAAASETATVHGVAYEWSTLSPLDNVIIEVNSTPIQSIVAKYGMYSFELPEGSYCITASYYVNGDLTCYDEENITITDEGNYVVDLLLVPSYLNNSTEEPASYVYSMSSSHLLILFVLIVLLLLVSLFFKVRGPGSSNPESVNKKNVPNGFSNKAAKGNSHTPFHGNRIQPIARNQSLMDMSSDHQEILDIIRSAGGTISQKELRRYLSYSEGKASTILVDLEKRGLIRKVKKGRGNILFLTGHER
ncbi:hypothetical protein RE474_04925 [Methanolobus sediminis]|uniref:DUF7343 domain-containing protein n=1 Tax=Methanolobus sediminis TaxID=3072978 RepID=A0AA51YMY2_9EURY|nr:hypothetical protein [Methanolobus sediminis]WMW26068.1 hypothetical protein RE474_04925 [Methanolobus sediminis]